jgi:5'-3' exonuclease
MKYRRLTNEELIPLEEELKHFLIVNGVHGEEWEKINKVNPERASELVEVFSDTVLQKVYEKLEYLEHRSAQTCMAFRCMRDSTELIVLQRKPDTSVDLSTPDSIHDALVKQLDSITFYTSSRKNTKERELEIHQLIEQGCVLSSGEFWQQLKVYTSSQQ